MDNIKAMKEYDQSHPWDLKEGSKEETIEEEKVQHDINSQLTKEGEKEYIKYYENFWKKY